MRQAIEERFILDVSELHDLYGVLATAQDDGGDPAYDKKAQDLLGHLWNSTPTRSTRR